MAEVLYNPTVFIEAICMQSVEWRIVEEDWTSRGQFKNPGSLFCKTRHRSAQAKLLYHEKTASLTSLSCENDGISSMMRETLHNFSQITWKDTI